VLLLAANSCIRRQPLAELCLEDHESLRRKLDILLTLASSVCSEMMPVGAKKLPALVEVKRRVASFAQPVGRDVESIPLAHLFRV
jgi:hypothetical protein